MLSERSQSEKNFILRHSRKGKIDTLKRSEIARIQGEEVMNRKITGDF
jgi:hypothetical protein